MLSDEMNEEKHGTKVPRTERRKSQHQMQDAGTRETAGIRCREKEERNRYHVLT